MEVDDKTIKKIEKILDSTMRSLIYGPGGDPSWHELTGSATCFEVLKLLDLKIKNEEEIRVTLEGENLYNDNFIKGF